jgi:hypothetical protein
MEEIQSTQTSAIPSWVMMDQRFRFKNLGSFRADGETSAETRDTNSDPVRVSCDLHVPPAGSSRLCLHSTEEERESSWWDMVVASHLDAVLFRVEIDFHGLWVNHRCALDYFVYRASSSELTLLPRCYSTEDEAEVEDASSLRRKLRMVHNSSIGLLVDEEQE